MDSDFLDVTESGSKKIFFFIIVIIVGLLVFGYFFVFQKYYFNVKNIKVELGSELSTNINDYLQKSVVDTSGYKLDLALVDTNTVGKYKYKVTYNGKVKNGKIEVKDTTAPEFTLQDYYVEVGAEDFYLGNVLEVCDDLSKPCIVEFKNENDSHKIDIVGDYYIQIKVSDVYKNTKNANAHIIVKEKGTLDNNSTTDLEYYSSSEDLEDFKDEYYIKLDKPINKDSIECTGYIDEISGVDWEGYAKENYPNYTFKEVTIVSIYNKTGYVIGYVVDLNLEGTSSTVNIFVTKRQPSATTQITDITEDNGEASE